MLINQLSISNFKSIEELNINPSRVNVFIGGPNAGKTNVIEALAPLAIGFPNYYKQMIRFDETADLFTDLEITKKININTNFIECSIEYSKNENGALMNRFDMKLGSSKLGEVEYWINHDGKLEGPMSPLKSVSTRVLLYIFRGASMEKHPGFRPFLDAPFGENLPNLLMTNAEYRKIVSDIFKDFGLRIVLRRTENKIFIVREEDETFIDFKYQNISSTVQRVVFMLLAIKSNNNSVLVFDEPEANIYPFYAQTIANHIAGDKTNQFFMTSHSAYLINRLIDQTPASDLNIYYTKMENYRTSVKKMTLEEVQRFASMGEDAMLNLNNIIE